MVSCLKNLYIHDNRRNLAPNIVDRPPIIYPEDNNGGVLPPYFTFGWGTTPFILLWGGAGPLAPPAPPLV